MKLDKIYIDEAIRIRKEYFKNLNYIIEQEKTLNNLKEKLDILDSEINDDNENEVKNKEILIKISVLIEEASSKMLPFNENIKKLDIDQLKLYNAIKEKYPNITDIEIENEIIPYIIDIKN